MGPRVRLDEREKFHLHRVSIPGPSTVASDYTYYVIPVHLDSKNMG